MSSLDRPEAGKVPILNWIAPIVVAFNLAIAQPILDVLGRNAEFFIARDATTFEIVTFAIGLAIVIPVLIGAAVAAVGWLDVRISRIALLAIFTVLMAAWSMTFVKPTLGQLRGSVQIAFAALIGGAIAVVLVRWRHAQYVMRWMLLMPIVVAGLFLFASPTSALVLPSTELDAGETQIENPVPLVILVFDELPVASLIALDGSIDENNFPGFARLASGSTWYRNTTTVDDHTNWAVPSILDGANPQKDLLPIAADHPSTLFELVAGDYRITAIEPITSLCTSDACSINVQFTDNGSRWASLTSDVTIVSLHRILPESWTWRLPPIDETWGDFSQTGLPEQQPQPLAEDEPNPTSEPSLEAIQANAREAIQSDHLGDFLAFVDLIQESDSPQFYFNHSMLPHRPWRYLPSGQQYPNLTVPGRVNGRWDSDEWLLVQGYQRHLLQVQLADRLLELVLDRLIEVGAYDDSMLVVVSDHGAAFELGAVERGVREDTIGSIAAVPLFIKYPQQQQGMVDDRPVTTLDIAPTITDVLGMTGGNPRFAGVSLLDENAVPRTERLISYLESDWLSVGLDGQDTFDVVERKYELFRAFDGQLDPFSIAPQGTEHLLNKQLGQLNIASPTEMTSSVSEGLAFYMSVDPDQALFPSLIDGLLENSDLEDPIVLAVSVNGKIAALTRTYTARRPGRWHAVLPPAAFVSGTNLIELFHVDGTGEDAVLRPVTWLEG